MKLPFHIVDVFTEKLQGNQLAVFRDWEGVSLDLMQRIAKEMNTANPPSSPPPTTRAASTRSVYSHPSPNFSLATTGVMGEKILTETTKPPNHNLNTIPRPSDNQAEQ